MIINDRYEEPYNKFPKEGPIPLLSKSVVLSKLSKKFWEYTKYLRQNSNNQTKKIIKAETSPEYNDENSNSNYEELCSNNNNNISYIKKERPRSTNKINSNSGKKIPNRNNENEINELKNIIFNLQNEVNRQNYIINQQRNEKMQLLKRIENLENTLANFC